jgi:trypsin
MASVRVRAMDRVKFGSGFLCAGAYIARQTVLTAASCVDGYSASHLQVALGSVDLTRRYFVSDITSIRVHRNFTMSNPMSNNIAILRMRSRLENNNIRAIRWSAYLPSPPVSCRFYGWGQEKNLVSASLPVWDQTRCQNSHLGVFCAGNQNNGPALCPRNLGGPYVCNNRVIGIAIDDSGCGRQGTTGQFTSLQHHETWMRGNSAVNFSSMLLLIFCFSLKFL